MESRRAFRPGSDDSAGLEPLDSPSSSLLDFIGGALLPPPLPPGGGGGGGGGPPEEGIGGGGGGGGPPEFVGGGGGGANDSFRELGAVRLAGDFGDETWSSCIISLAGDLGDASSDSTRDFRSV